jgi:hypothetical protein
MVIRAGIEPLVPAKRQAHRHAVPARPQVPVAQLKRTPLWWNRILSWSAPICVVLNLDPPKAESFSGGQCGISQPLTVPVISVAAPSCRYNPDDTGNLPLYRVSPKRPGPGLRWWLS